VLPISGTGVYMCQQNPFHSAIKWLGAAADMTAAAYGAYTAITWLSYGHAKLVQCRRADPPLDVFMPNYDIQQVLSSPYFFA
jgi:hypothetical protein